MGSTIIEKSMFKQNELEDLEKLLVIARGQKNYIYLNLIYMSLTLNEKI